jgi:hypothetical protein
LKARGCDQLAFALKKYSPRLRKAPLGRILSGVSRSLLFMLNTVLLAGGIAATVMF